MTGNSVVDSLSGCLTPSTSNSSSTVIVGQTNGVGGSNSPNVYSTSNGNNSSSSVSTVTTLRLPPFCSI
ncbi:hypothetical protein DERP_001101 [Dermatophagoides pteronyssinus]|uniref:Uncharacterized protein n=1 Tax=Dermatophagoides pteronyssinus TaxID=6956 RepID=A0ABQ8JE87_DERPT|nr:hypothetical protein DERP_001101 [Dermatophagoides pteronyssinus]